MNRRTFLLNSVAAAVAGIFSRDSLAADFVDTLIGDSNGPLDNYLFATFGDSRVDPFNGVARGPDLFNAVNTGARGSPSPFTDYLPQFRNDFVHTANGGVGGDTSGNWNSGSRTQGRTITAVLALPWEAIMIQYDANDVTGASSTATRDSIAIACIANNQALITALLNGKPNAKVIFQTCMQRTETFANESPNFYRRDCCDYINYGNGGAITGMTAWIQAHPLYNTRLFIHDISSLMNVGGAQTGAYLDPAWTGDGLHVNASGGRHIANDFATVFSTVFPRKFSGITPVYRSTGENYVAYVSSSSYKSQQLSHCSVSSVTYGTDADGYKYGEMTVTPDNVANGTISFSIHADTGTNGGRTPVGPTFAVNDLLQSRMILTIDDGSGGVPPAIQNVFTEFTCIYIGGTPANQLVDNGVASAGTVIESLADITAAYSIRMKMTGDSSLIGAPAPTSGLYTKVTVYFATSSTPFRIRFYPEIRKIL